MFVFYPQQLLLGCLDPRFLHTLLIRMLDGKTCWPPWGPPMIRTRTFATAILATLVFSFCIPLHAQDPLNPTLTGSANFGDVGRHIGVNSLGTITIDSDDLMGADAFVVKLNQDGYAYLGNGLVLRNESGSDLTFTGNNESHTLAVYSLASGAYSFSGALPTLNQYENGDGTIVNSFGGHWHWEGDYARIDGSTANFTLSSHPEQQFLSDKLRVSPLDLTEKRRSPDADDDYNRTDSTRPMLPSVVKVANQPLNWRLDETSTPVIERHNALITVDQGMDQPLPTLDLSGIDVTASGTSLRDRYLYDGIVKLGRQMVGSGTTTISRMDSVDVKTVGDDDQFTRLQLGAFSESNSDVSATLGSASTFNDKDDTATISLNANFSFDSSNLGTFVQGVEIGSHISTLENGGLGLTGETVQSGLVVGYSYGVVDNNDAVSNSITAYVLDTEDPAGEYVINHSVRQKYSKLTHTDISISNVALMNGSDVQTVTLSAGNGIAGEGLAGENVTATTTYQIHKKVVQSSLFNHTPEGNASESTIVLSNDRAFDGSKIQAESTLVGETTVGSTRWTLNGLAGWDGSLSAGETLTLTPLLDESGLGSGTLGRSFWSNVSLTFRDDVAGISSHNVAGTFTGEFLEDGKRQQLLGTTGTQKTITYSFEKENSMEGTSGDLMLVAGSSLSGEGVNLTNTADNSSAATPTTMRILDSEVVTSSTELSIGFTDLADANAEFTGAAKFGLLTGDIVSITGLDGIKHVLELSNEEGSGLTINWFDEGGAGTADDAWVNAILGNSDVVSYDILGDSITTTTGTETLTDYYASRQFNTSYAEYLLSLGGMAPELGAFGSYGGKVWAVIDHNSFFAVATPEPGAALLFSVALVATTGRRRRSKSS